MVAQTSINQTGGGDNSPPQAVARNTGELLADAMTLAELQGKLLLHDVRSDLRNLMIPLVLIVMGSLLVIACLPMALAALALGLVAAGIEELWIAFLISLGVGALLAVCLLAGGVWYLFHGLSFLARSRSEWDQNVRWFKGLLRRLGTRGSAAG